MIKMRASILLVIIWTYNIMTIRNYLKSIAIQKHKHDKWLLFVSRKICICSVCHSALGFILHTMTWWTKHGIKSVFNNVLRDLREILTSIGKLFIWYLFLSCPLGKEFILFHLFFNFVVNEDTSIKYYNIKNLRHRDE